MKVTGQSITQLCFIRDIVRRLERYSQLRWYRSANGIDGPFEPATDVEARPAALYGGLAADVPAGTSICLRIDGEAPREVTFPSAVSIEAAVDMLQSELPELSISAQDGALLFETVALGSTASIEVLDSAGPTAASYLGLSVGEVAVGRDANLELDAETTLYGYEDRQADPGFFYIAELFNPVTGYREAVGTPFASRGFGALGPDKLVGGYVSLCDMSGNPLVGRRVIIYNALLPNRIIDSGNGWGVFRQSMEAAADARGYAEFVLVRGVEIDVSIAGTGFTRHIRVPDSGQAVDLLDPVLDMRDEFGIQKTPIDFAIRTTL